MIDFLIGGAEIKEFFRFLYGVSIIKLGVYLFGIVDFFLNPSRSFDITMLT